MIGNYIKATSGGGGPLFPIDADAQAFITAANITDNTQQNAINILVTSMKDYGIWGKMDAIYPFVGGTASSHKYNLKDPQDTDAAFRLVFNGGWTHDANGVTPNGVNAYAETFYNLLTNSLQNDASNGVYCRTNSNGGASYGADNSSFIGSSLLIKANDNKTYWSSNDNLGLGVSSVNFITDTKGFFVINRKSITTRKLYKNSEVILSLSNLSTTPQNLQMYFGAGNRDNVVSNYDSKNYSLFFLAKGLTDGEIGMFYGAVQLFQKILNRQV